MHFLVARFPITMIRSVALDDFFCLEEARNSSYSLVEKKLFFYDKIR